jgi:3-hydroxyisobutyrate dehydrogenase-like beta-hydroxyacid dehydrogenase
MASHLIAGGHALFLYSRRPSKAELIDKGAVACASAKEVAERSDWSMRRESERLAAIISMRRFPAARSAPRRPLTIMVGGSAALFEKVRPLLSLMGKNITRVGEAGDGQTCKVANQIIVALTIEAVGEALVDCVGCSVAHFDSRELLESFRGQNSLTMITDANQQTEECFHEAQRSQRTQWYRQRSYEGRHYGARRAHCWGNCSHCRYH